MCVCVFLSKLLTNLTSCKPQEYISGCLLGRFSALRRYKPRGYAVDMTMLQKNSAITKNEVHTSFNIAIPQILLPVMQIQGILCKYQVKNDLLYETPTTH